MTSVARLIQYFTPKNYDLLLDINEQEKTFIGTVTIQGTINHPQKYISFHSKDLSITSVVVNGNDAQYTREQDDELRIAINESNTTSKDTVAISFTGSITDPMYGLYPCYFTDGNKKKKLFATQFESHHARDVFPCIDEPFAKATFNLTLVTEPGQTVLSNMPAKSTEVRSGRQSTIFETTPRMSTYLLAFVIGELHKKSAMTKNNIEVNVWATPVQPSERLDFALDTAVEAIEFYEDYFDTPYPLPKCDHVALPDFTVGAMENWGLITYRETTLLADPASTSIIDKHHVAVVIAHELAHQWFGNLVTMAWWNDLWLNESFANLMEYIAIDAVYPDWNIWLDYVTHEPVIALRRDSLDGVQAVQVDVDHPDAISTLFDPAIVYAKGGRLLRMIQQYIGHEAFRAGLKAYFTKHAYKNTVGDDLWDELESASGKQIKEIMNIWISQPGYPVVTLERRDNQLTIFQKQFTIGTHAPSERLWPIPLNTDSPTIPELLTARSTSVTTGEMPFFNKNDSSHYITNYDPTSRKYIIDQIAHGSLDSMSKIQFLDESILLTKAGMQSTVSLLPILEAFKNETSEPVWNMMWATLSEFHKFVEDNDKSSHKLRQLSVDIARNQYTRLGWTPIENEPEEDTRLRRTIIKFMLYGEDPDAISKAHDLFTSIHLENLDPDLRPLIIAAVSKSSDGKIVDEIMKIHNNTTSGNLRNDISVGITSTKIPEKIEYLLEFIKNPEIIRPQDVFRWFIYLMRNEHSRSQTWQWIRDNWDWIEKTFKGDMGYDDYPRYAATSLSTKKQLAEYKEFFEPLRTVPELKRTIEMGINEIEARVELIERDKREVQEALLAFTLTK